MSGSRIRLWMWVADFFDCGCTDLKDFRKELLSECPKHKTKQRTQIRVVNEPHIERGLVS